ncbi:MAG: hypothetical protein ABR602_07730 [Gemmatimonadales bacterium]
MVLLGAWLAACAPTRPGADLTEEWLGAAADTVLTPFGQVPRAAWMGPNRWLVVASDWDQAVVADFTTNSYAPLGSGPGTDYQNPADVFAAGDSLYLSDWGMRRVTVWTRDGQLGGAIDLPIEARVGFPKARDTAGRFYFEPPPTGGVDGQGLVDSGAVVRASPDLVRFDTLARLSPPPSSEVTRDQRRRLERMVFGGQDRWGVRPDGSFWVARIARNQVTWTDAAGESRRGPSLPDPVYEVTMADREEFVAQFPPELRGTVEALPFAMIKPPFEGAFTGPEGQIWLEKSRSVHDSLAVRRVHVVGDDGDLARMLVVPSLGRVIAVGEGVLLVAEQWAEGVRLLQISTTPPPAAAAIPRDSAAP